MTSTITLITGEGSVRVYGDNLVLDLRTFVSGAEGEGSFPSLAAREADESAASNQGEGNGLALPVGTATEKQAACSDRPDPIETPAVCPPQQVDRAGEAILPVSPAILSGANLGAASGSDGHLSEKKLVVNSAKIIRKHCQQPELCRSGTRDHCHTCKKAMAESEAA